MLMATPTIQPEPTDGQLPTSKEINFGEKKNPNFHDPFPQVNTRRLTMPMRPPTPMRAKP